MAHITMFLRPTVHRIAAALLAAALFVSLMPGGRAGAEIKGTDGPRDPGPLLTPTATPRPARGTAPPLIVPSDLRISNWHPTELQLSWTPTRLAPHAVIGTAAYTIVHTVQRRRPPGTTWTSVVSVQPLSSQLVRIWDDQLIPSTEYCYRLRVERITPPAESFTPERCDRTAPPSPAAPTNLTVAVTQTTATNVWLTLRWYDNAIDEAKFRLYGWHYWEGGSAGQGAGDLDPLPGTGWTEHTLVGTRYGGPDERFCYTVTSMKFDGYHWSWASSDEICAEISGG